MVIKSLELETVCGITSKFPENDKLEMAFWGRSNVGKSSLINTLMNRKSFARISSQPGKTQTVNYYNVNDIFYLVDLPGYGYAKVSKEVAAKWMKMIERYLHASTQLKAVLLLVDSKGCGDVPYAYAEGIESVDYCYESGQDQQNGTAEKCRTDKEKAGSRRRDTDHPIFRPDKGRKRRDLGIY